MTASCTISTRSFDAIIFDMDGVVTRTADLHARAWKRTFDEFFEQQSEKPHKPFDVKKDYSLYVDGKPRYDGVESFLDAREVKLPYGSIDDEPGFETICSVGNLKDKYFHDELEETGAKPYESTIQFIRAARQQGLKTGIITSSRNGSLILKTARLSDLFDVEIDGIKSSKLNLKGKPAPDIFLKAAELMAVSPARTVIVEDAISGVEGGHDGGFGLVIGIDRQDNADLLRDHGADAVVQDLSEVEIKTAKSSVSIDAATGACAASYGLAGSTRTERKTQDHKDWILSYEDYDPEVEGQRESLCALGNGYFCSRGSAPESVEDAIHYPATYIAGGYNELTSKVGDDEMSHEDLVRLPDWQSLSFKIEDGPWFSVDDVEIVSFHQQLNIKEGVLCRKIVFRDANGRETTISDRRFVHLRCFHLAGLETKISANNWSGKLQIRNSLDADVVNNGVVRFAPLRNRHLEKIESNSSNDILFLRTKTTQSQLIICQAVKIDIVISSVSESGKDQRKARHFIYSTGEQRLDQNCTIELAEGETAIVQKIASIYTSRDNAVSEPGAAAIDAVQHAPSFEKLLDEHIEAWRHLWQRFDLELENEQPEPGLIASLLLRLHSFHVLQTATTNSSDLDAGIPARGWTGEGYQGHVFWDELFVFPFLNLRLPEVTRACLKYRYRRLNAARKLARQLGARGARFPGQSGSNGDEKTPRYLYFPISEKWVVDNTHLQIHVGLAVAYNVWHFYETTGDVEFMNAFGAEMLFEIAQFFSSYARFSEEKQRFEILAVVGPDEYHVGYPDSDKPGINNNAYTNVMASWALRSALNVLAILPDDELAELLERLDITQAHIDLWEHVSRNMFLPVLENGIIDQFEGYSSLLDFPFIKDGGIDYSIVEQMLEEEGGHLNKYKISKQADLLMLFYLFNRNQLEELFSHMNYEFPQDMISKNIAYYTPQTAHNSTLSRVAQAWVLSRLDRKNALKYLRLGLDASRAEAGNQSVLENNDIHWHSWNVFVEALSSDFADIQGGTTREGIHIGAMAGTVDIVQRCYTGLAVHHDTLWINPNLPRELKCLSFNLRYRQQSLSFEITQKKLKIKGNRATAEPVSIRFKDETRRLTGGEFLEFDL